MLCTIKARYPGRDSQVLLHKASRKDSASKMIDQFFTGMYIHALDSDAYGVRYEITVETAHQPTVGVEFFDKVFYDGEDTFLRRECQDMIESRCRV